LTKIINIIHPHTFFGPSPAIASTHLQQIARLARHRTASLHPPFHCRWLIAQSIAIHPSPAADRQAASPPASALSGRKWLGLPASAQLLLLIGDQAIQCRFFCCFQRQTGKSAESITMRWPFFKATETV
jgi:hypothetical protein